jgi:hypothetical protein
MNLLATLDTALAAHHLMILGGFEVADGDGLADTGTLLLVGPHEPAFWPAFTQSREYASGVDNPLDQWSLRVIGSIANDIGGSAYFPFGGPPYQPFYRWALRTGRFWASPIRLLVHDTAGLFVSMRGAILIPAAVQMQVGTNPCDSCRDTPCKTACPVDAFSDGYDVPACKTHVRSTAGQDCRAAGCRARHACPVGQGRRLPAQAAFHMEAFL